jgi:hypothetical protein
MISFLRPGHLVIMVRAGEAPAHVPCHVDLLAGAARPAGRLDGGIIDSVLRRYGGGSRYVSEYHARQSLGRVGAQHVGYDDYEEAIGMSRTYKVEIGEPEKSRDAVEALRDLAVIERAAVQRLSCAPCEVATPTSRRHVVTKAQAWEPHERIHAREAHQLERGDERVTTAVVDTGITVGHPEFQRKCLAGYDTVDLGIGRLNDDLRLYGDSRGHDYNPRDEVGHGCHVAGIIGAQGWRIPEGIGGKSLLLAVRVLAAASPVGGGKRMGIGALCDINAGLKVAVDLGADVINMSLGTPESATDPGAGLPHEKVIRYATHYGCVLVAAAGNSGAEEKYYPAAHPDVIAVGSVDRQGRRSHFSTFGEQIALCAPGENIVSTGRRGYQINSGTSFASPFVAGVAALLVARARRHGKKLDTAAVRRIVTAAAAPLGGGVNRETGHGLLDALAAIRFLDRELGRSS